MNENGSFKFILGNESIIFILSKFADVLYSDIILMYSISVFVFSFEINLSQNISKIFIFKLFSIIFISLNIICNSIILENIRKILAIYS